MAPFADLKRRAGEGYTSTKDKYSSTPSSNLGYNPPRPGNRFHPPPPQAPRNGAQPVPPVPESYDDEEAEPDRIDWANLSYEDKQVFFSWLDEFFSRFTGRPISSFVPAVHAEPSGEPSPIGTPPITPALPRRPTAANAVAPDVVPPPMPPRRTSSAPLAPPMPPRRASSQSSAPPMPPRRTSSQSLVQAPPMPPRRSDTSPQTPSGNGIPPPRRAMPPPPAGPPKPNYNTRPSAPNRETSVHKPATPGGDPLAELQMSYPASTAHGSTAADLAHYFSADTIWGPGDDWYTSSPVPTMHSGPDAQIRGSGAFRSFPSSDTTVLHSGIIFADMSVCYFRVTYPSGPHSPDDYRIRREAWYTLRPPPMSGDALVAAHDTYGEIIASFAESHVASGQKVWRGECWDIAYKGLELAREQCPDQPPVPSISRCHGHLIYCGKPGQGRWRGGDTRVRRGDIVEWRLARVKRMGQWSTIGAPDHTAVIVKDCIPSIPVSDGSFLTPAELGDLTIVGQNPNPPRVSTVPHATMAEGEVWIYRPVCMQEYVGFELGSADPPAGLRVISI
ncbi:unnamed protein product [Peniophora sp. CBMAI 1063]|nr:unnamed protein product [Peniophora sp. CBMAI 1063]